MESEIRRFEEYHSWTFIFELEDKLKATQKQLDIATKDRQKLLDKAELYVVVVVILCLFNSRCVCPPCPLWLAHVWPSLVLSWSCHHHTKHVPCTLYTVCLN